MTTAHPTLSTSAARPVRTPRMSSGTLRHLLGKELRESRSAILAGLVIFWAMPAWWAAVDCALDSSHDVTSGFALGLLAGAGWLYAIVIGASTVCRDLGKPAEQFLLGRPVQPRTIVLSKLIAGALVLCVVVGTSGLWDLALRYVRCRNPQHPAVFFDWTLIVVSVFLPALILAAYVLAFAVAVMTRQMLAGAMAAGLGLIVWAAGPLVSERLSALSPFRVLYSAMTADAWRAFPSTLTSKDLPIVWGVVAQALLPLAVLLVVIAASVTAAVVFAGQERARRIGNKSFAWAVAIVILSLFALAMTEVGSTLRVADRAIWSNPSGSRQLIAPWQSGVFYAHRESRVCATSFSPFDFNGSPHPIAWFEVSGQGHVKNLRSDRLAFPPLPKNMASDYGVSVFRASDKGELVVGGCLLRQRFEGAKTERKVVLPPEAVGVFQTRLTWPDENPPTVISHCVLPFPESSVPKGRLASIAMTDRYAYVLWCRVTREPEAPHRGGAPTRTDATLQAYDLMASAGKGPLFSVRRTEQGGLSSFLETRDACLYAYPGNDVYAVRLPADDPTAVAAGWPKSPVERLDQSYRGPLPTRYIPQASSTMPPRLGNVKSADCVVNGRLIISETLGLRVVEGWDAADRNMVVGEYQASPLSVLFNGVSGLQGYSRGLVPIDDSLVVQLIGRGSMDLFDISDPTRPRRVAHYVHDRVLLPDAQGGQILSLGRYLVMLESMTGYWGDGLTVNIFDRPNAR